MGTERTFPLPSLASLLSPAPPHPQVQGHRGAQVADRVLSHRELVLQAQQQRFRAPAGQREQAHRWRQLAAQPGELRGARGLAAAGRRGSHGEGRGLAGRRVVPGSGGEE